MADGKMTLNLKLERELRGMSLSQLSAKTKIPIHHLELMEMDRFYELPNDFFIRGYLKAYCDTLGLDREKIFLDYQFIRNTNQEKSNTKQTRSNTPERGKRAVPIIGFILMTLLALLWVTRDKIESNDWHAADSMPQFSSTLPPSPLMALSTLKKWAEQQVSFSRMNADALSMEDIPVHDSVYIHARDDIWINTQFLHDGREQLMAVFKGESRIIPVGRGVIVLFSDKSAVDVYPDGNPSESMTLKTPRVRFVPGAEKAYNRKTGAKGTTQGGE